MSVTTYSNKPLHINSGYRCPALNKALMVAKNSSRAAERVVLYDEGYEGEYLA